MYMSMHLSRTMPPHTPFLQTLYTRIQTHNITKLNGSVFPMDKWPRILSVWVLIPVCYPQGYTRVMLCTVCTMLYTKHYTHHTITCSILVTFLNMCRHMLYQILLFFCYLLLSVYSYRIYHYIRKGVSCSTCTFVSPQVQYNV